MKETWHWICIPCADLGKHARWYRIDGTRRPGDLCCYCQQRPPAGVLEGKGTTRHPCSCSETS